MKIEQYDKLRQLRRLMSDIKLGVSYRLKPEVYTQLVVHRETMLFTTHPVRTLLTITKVNDCTLRIAGTEYKIENLYISCTHVHWVGLETFIFDVDNLEVVVENTRLRKK